MKTVLLLFALFVFVGATLVAVSDRTWTRRTAQIVAELNGAAFAPPESTFTAARLDSLPPPVARYLRAVLRDGVPLVRHAVLTHEGVFRGDLDNPGEWSFRSVQHFGADPPGFVWDARMHLAPLVDVYVRDALVGGQAFMRARVAGMFPVVEAGDDAQLDVAAAQRWLAETAWFPTALLPGQGVKWTAVDDTTALATVGSGALTARLEFRFGADSLVSSVFSSGRGRAVGGSIVPTPWRGRWSGWQWRDGMRVPGYGEVAWELVSGPVTYWRGTVVDATYE